LQKVAPIAALLIREKLTIATAESLTSGLIAASLTSIAGSSAYFLAGFNTYSNESKERFLEVPEEIIARSGAVSRQCSEAMAQNARRLVGADLGLSSTGIAGPDGATATKPVGLVYLTVTGAKNTFTERNIYSGSRHEVTIASVLGALELLEKYLA
jgi:PncC family amidohydrolase